MAQEKSRNLRPDLALGGRKKEAYALDRIFANCQRLIYLQKVGWFCLNMAEEIVLLAKTEI